MAAFELRYHNAMPGWVKVLGLKIRAVHECEGGGFCIAEDQAKAIVAAPDMLTALRAAGEALHHDVPGSCWATGPLTGDPVEDLVVCPGCRALHSIRAAIAKATGSAA